MSATGLAHGLQGTLVEPDWQPLTLAEVRVVLSQLPACGKLVKILTSSPRPFSAASVVETERRHVFIKRHHRSVRNWEGLLEEHRFLQHLRDHGSQVSRVLANIDGQTAFEFNEFSYEVHEAAAGFDAYGDALSWTPFRNCAHARSAGQALAGLHRAAEGFDAPARLPRPLVASFTIFASQDPSTELKNYLAARPALAQHVEAQTKAKEAFELLAPFHAELKPYLPALHPLWTHNDAHASNLFWSDGSPGAKVSAVIDFGLADRTNAVHDLAHAIERNIVEWLLLKQESGLQQDLPVHLDHLQAMLSGYESVRGVSEEEARALAPMVALCHAEFALSEADYFLGVLHSEERARMAYEGWLVGHAYWFHNESGEKLLNFLRRWADGRTEKREKL